MNSKNFFPTANYSLFQTCCAHFDKGVAEHDNFGKFLA